MNLTVRFLKLTILEALSSGQPEHKFNLIGRSSQPGGVESRLRIQFDPEHQQMAAVAFDELQASDFIRPTYSDLIDPERWVKITDSGQRALQRRTLDILDVALSRIASNLVELREGAWAAIATPRADSLRQAAHSTRELIDQTLKSGATDDVVRSMPGFIPDRSSRSGITRRHRLKYLMITNRGTVSDSDLKVAEQACDLALATDEKLKALAHSRASISVDDVKDALMAAEIALRKVLVRDNDAV
jgi:Predicted pPIWI-associating nuclease